jgi:hypothetical protein
MDGILRRKLKTFSRAKPQRPQRTAKNMALLFYFKTCKLSFARFVYARVMATAGYGFARK